MEDDANEWRIWLTENAKRGIDFLAKTIAATVAKRVAASSLKWIEDSSSPAGDSWPRITKRLVAKISPWVDLVAREVEFSPRTGSQTYHSVATFDYVIVLAVTPDGRIPLVRQYRPAVEGMTLELPAGTVDTGEDPAATAIRELLEETGLPSKAVHLLGINKTDAGRLSNRVYSYFVRAGDQIAGFRPEEGVAVGFVTPSELVGAVRSGELDAQADLGTILLAELFGHLVLRY
ncbi:NUDIX hydrolase [Bradyrhizobium sp.]|uniref:NUDIX hydrolase n=1 Tax=Bradyrhizobium sp. TaxID=376 RepID=UPI00261FBB42|nr:NUDIX hydrolase [Bradyrhizobium sp.]